MQGNERAFPYAWNGQATWGFTKRERIAQEITKAIVAGLYGYKGDLNKMTEDQIIAQALKISDALIKVL